MFNKFKFQLYNIYFEDSDEPGHPPGLNRELRFQCSIMQAAKTLIRLGDGQADLSPRWERMSFYWCRHAVAQM